MAERPHADTLPARYRLHWYVIERPLGQGGFGITYLAHDSNLDRRVAVKEYFPVNVAQRRQDMSVRPTTESQADRYARGLERFLAEARTLARFDHPNIVHVLAVFEANNSAYIVMRFEEGEDLETLLERNGTLTEEHLRALLTPLLDGLHVIHAAGFIHRDVKPKNIYVRHDGQPVLIDFGSARQAFGDPRPMTVLVAPGYAPLEQYYGDPKQQGPWTDVYGLAATCYRAVAGREPLDAVVRAKSVLSHAQDMLDLAADVGRGSYSAELLNAVDHGLQLSERNRPQSIAEWRQELDGPLQWAGHAIQPSRGRLDEKLSAASAILRSRAVLMIAIVGVAAAVGSQVLPSILAASPGTPQMQEGVALTPLVSNVPPTVSPAQTELLAELADASAVAFASSPSPLANLATQPALRERRPPFRALSDDDRTVRQQQQQPASASEDKNRSTNDRLPSTAIRDAEPDATAASQPGRATTPLPPENATAYESSQRDSQIADAERAMRRGDVSAATRILIPLATAGVGRAQALLARAQELRPVGQRSEIEAYIWYSLADRSGEPGAAVAREKLVGRLLPAERRQADQIVDRWKAGDAASAVAE